MTELRFTADPAALLSLAGGLLARQGLVSTVVATTVRRDLRRQEAGAPRPADRPYWFVVALDDGEPVGVAMRAAERAPHPLFVLPMPERHARELGARLHLRGEEVRAVNGALPACRQVAGEYAARAGLEVAVRMHTRLHRLGELRPPRPVPGRLRPVEPGEAELAASWLTDFQRDVEVQAGRPAPTAHGASPAPLPSWTWPRSGCGWTRDGCGGGTTTVRCTSWARARRLTAWPASPRSTRPRPCAAGGTPRRRWHG